MSDARFEVCAPWALVPQLVARCEASSDETLLSDCLKMASDVLFNFTRQRWPGLCEDLVRPCQVSACAGPGSWAGWWSEWWSSGTGGLPGIPGQASARMPAQTSCGCGFLPEFDLPTRDVQGITQVKLDGQVLNPAAYRLDDGYKLVRIDGEWWPTCQDLTLDDDSEGTWSVAYTYGQAPPIGGEKACLALACQLAWAHKPDAVRDGRCRLPKRVTSITRQGVTMALIDPLSLFDEGKTGIAEVDLWVASINRGEDTRQGVVIDPMRSRSVRRTS